MTSRAKHLFISLVALTAILALPAQTPPAPATQDAPQTAAKPAPQAAATPAAQIAVKTDAQPVTKPGSAKSGKETITRYLPAIPIKVVAGVKP